MSDLIDGKVLWFSVREGNGIIVDDEGYEFYFDTSVTFMRNKDLKRGDLVDFLYNPRVKDCRCACMVRKAVK